MGDFDKLNHPITDGLFLRPVVKNKNLIQMGPQDGTKFTVGRVGQIGVAVGVAAKGDKEAVGEAVGLAFDTDISPPFKGVDGIDLAW